MSDALVSSDPIDVRRLIEHVSGAGHGGIATFIGTVRNVNDGRPVDALEYSAYETMAARELERILAEALSRWPDTVVAARHRIGVLRIGDVSVVVAAGSPHRAAAFEACRYTIEELKRRVPIWKREHYVDGTREWVDPNA